MPVIATADYVGERRDRVETFNGKQLVYVTWEQHLLIAASMLFCPTPDTPMRTFLNEMVFPLLQQDPDGPKVKWEEVEWKLHNQPWTPDLEGTLASNGVTHKSHIIFATPGLNTIMGSACS